MLHWQALYERWSRSETCSPSSNRLLKFAIVPALLLLLSQAPVVAEQFQVFKVINGNTIAVRGERGKKISVRLVGIDAPVLSTSNGESGQPFSQQSAQHLASLVLNRVVDIKPYGLDGFGRMLGEVFASDKNINMAMVRAGLAEVFRGRPTGGLSLEAYWEAEKEARDANRGMWAQGDKYVSPREWKK